MDQPERITYIGEQAISSSTSKPDTTPSPIESVDRIREIIFGHQMRDYDHRFSKLEQQLSEAIETLRTDTRQRFDSLEKFIKQELESFSARLSKESEERSAQDTVLSDSFRKSDAEIDRQVKLLDEQSAKLASSLRDLVLEQSKNLFAEMQQKNQMLNTTINTHSDTLREAMTDRRMLADLFSELSLRLKKELNFPQHSQ